MQVVEQTPLKTPIHIGIKTSTHKPHQTQSTKEITMQKVEEKGVLATLV
jgi:hypothetical protein